MDGVVGRTGFAKIPGSLDLDRNHPEENDKGPQDADGDVEVTDVEGRHLGQRKSVVVGKRGSDGREGTTLGDARFFVPSRLASSCLLETLNDKRSAHLQSYNLLSRVYSQKIGQHA